MYLIVVYSKSCLGFVSYERLTTHMKRSIFRRYLAQLDTLTATQRRQAIAAIQRPDPIPFPAQVREREPRLKRERQCVYCESKGARKHGRTSGLMQSRCLADGCGNTYTALSTTGLAKPRHRPKWERFQDCLRQRTTPRMLRTGATSITARRFDGDIAFLPRRGSWCHRAAC